MRLFEISPGTLVDLEKVESVVTSEVGTTLFISGKGYETTFNFNAIKGLFNGSSMENNAHVVNSPHTLTGTNEVAY